MPRSTNSVPSRKRRRRVLSQASGYWGKKNNIYRYAKDAVDRAGQYAYRDRRKRKSDFRGLWIQRINAGVRLHGMTYSQFISGLKKSSVEIDRKILAELAVNQPDTFKALVEKAQSAN